MISYEDFDIQSEVPLSFEPFHKDFKQKIASSTLK